jgi:hypothetical protein
MKIFTPVKKIYNVFKTKFSLCFKIFKILSILFAFLITIFFIVPVVLLFSLITSYLSQKKEEEYVFVY